MSANITGTKIFWKIPNWEFEFMGYLYSPWCEIFFQANALFQVPANASFAHVVCDSCFSGHLSVDVCPYYAVNSALCVSALSWLWLKEASEI